VIVSWVQKRERRIPLEQPGSTRIAQSEQVNRLYEERVVALSDQEAIDE
jgi:hypothetical protein